MSTQKSTREKLAQAIKEEMEQTSLDRITVARIVERAGVTRQTFYRNFKDKYDLSGCPGTLPSCWRCTAAGPSR